MNDTLDYQSILNPSVVPRDRASKVLSNLAGRTFWHKLFDNTPSLARALGEDGSVAALLSFLAYCDERDFSLDWRMSLRFLLWLIEKQPSALSSDTSHLLECLSAAAAAWAGEVVDLGMHRIIIACSHCNLVVGAVRTQAIDTGAKVFQLQLDIPSDLTGRFVYSVSSHPDRWSANQWRVV